MGSSVKRSISFYMMITHCNLVAGCGHGAGCFKQATFCSYTLASYYLANASDKLTCQLDTMWLKLSEKTWGK